MERSRPTGNVACSRRHRRRALRALPAAALLALAGCSFGAPKSAQDLATEDFCRQQANQIYDMQHREQLIAEDNSTTPLSSTGTLSDPSAGLSDLYAHEQRVDDCVSRKTSATNTGTTFGPQGPN